MFIKVTVNMFLLVIFAGNFPQFFQQHPEKPMSVDISGKATSRKNVVTEWAATIFSTEEHKECFAAIRSDPNVYPTFNLGQNPNTPYRMEQINTQMRLWDVRRLSGDPRAGHMIYSEKQSIGHCVMGGGDSPGHAEIAYTVIGLYQGKGVGSSVVSTYVGPVAKEASRIGHGINLQETDEVFMQRFQCYGGKALETLDATTSTNNPHSFKILISNGFIAAPVGRSAETELPIFLCTEEDITCEQVLMFLNDPKLESNNATVQMLLKNPNKRFHIMCEGKLRTLSYKGVNDDLGKPVLKYHWEKAVQVDGFD